jgi:hypothetical protein
MEKEEFRKLRTDLIEAANFLERCWGHHGDGSDLMVDKSALFDIMYHKVFPLLRRTVRRIHEETGDKSGKDFECDVCGIKRDYGGPCIYCTPSQSRRIL